MAKRNTKAVQRVTKAASESLDQPRYTITKIDTELGMTQAVNEIYATLAKGEANFDQSKLMLGAIGKVLNLQNLKARIGLHKAGRFGFFLEA